MADQLVALVQGGTVQGFKAQDGQLAWSQRLNFEPTSRFLPVGDQLLILDRSKDNSHSEMYLVNPATWASNGPITLPECAGQFVNLEAMTLYNPARGSSTFFLTGRLGHPAFKFGMWLDRA